MHNTRSDNENTQTESLDQIFREEGYYSDNIHYPYAESFDELYSRAINRENDYLNHYNEYVVTGEPCDVDDFHTNVQLEEDEFNRLEELDEVRSYEDAEDEEINNLNEEREVSDEVEPDEMRANEHRQPNQKVLQAIIKALEGESESIDFYERLIRLAPNVMARDAIRHALQDEREHLQMFRNLYKQLTGREPRYERRRKTFRNFQDGLLTAFYDELEAYEAYRDAYLLTRNIEVRDVFYHALTDEIGHATRFGFVYNQLY